MERILKQVFGLDSFRPGQRDIVNKALKGEDVIAVMPTGGGKSLCYQFPAVAQKGLVVVVSPLISLMNDQVYSLLKRGIKAGCIHSHQTESQQEAVLAKITQVGEFVLYVSPERVQMKAFREILDKRKPVLFAIDEAHCVSQWGHDFRKEYNQLGLLKKIFPDVPVMALTASATPTVLDDISKQLGIETAERKVFGFYRENLYYQVENCSTSFAKLSFIKDAIDSTPEGRIIIYAGTRKNVESVCRVLKKMFDKVDFYHGGVGKEDRYIKQARYMAGTTRILVATNAFGMGVDQPDVRLVIHYQIPGNIDALYQEMGRAGRDRARALCVLLFDHADIKLQQSFINMAKVNKGIKELRRKNLDSLIRYAQSSKCRWNEILEYYNDPDCISKCGHCDNCSSI